MKQTISIFIDSNKTLFESSTIFLSNLGIHCDSETAGPINVSDLYDQAMPQYLTEALHNIDYTYFIGIANNESLSGLKTNDSIDGVAKLCQDGGKYDGMFIFACDAKPKANITRTEISSLTRAFNRIASANPVILILRQENILSLATCERMEYNQAWRIGTGERLGKVSILRNINCKTPHRGHIDILKMLGEKTFTTFEELYKHWMEVFSNELLTKKFYNELSDWYAWAVKIVKFPNDIRTDKDDTIYNQESCIRLITRLIFVWFLKQKHLIPEEFFDEKYIYDNLIAGFNPHDKDNLQYKTSESKYYRLILQNLFFATLNCPIVAEGKKTPDNRRFRGDKQVGYVREGYNINNLMRYKSEFADGGAEKFLKLANQIVPFLNGGLFSCLDNKKSGLYYDGFSERKESLEQLYLPDYLFFGEKVGKGIDLSQWYGDTKKKNVSARGLIDILKHYSFTIEENTPYDQEVSLDPELLGKVFENLLAAYNPETQTSARKQTGSFYTPREIVQYMVDECLVAHLKRSCGAELEPKYRQLISYATQDVDLSIEQRKAIMRAIYNCRVLDPACGSGAFPMGVLQQMVHVLKRIDPSNEMWNNMMVDLATEETRKELEKVASDNEKEKNRIEENKKARLEDIENAFNQNINDPDYARKLYLIEHCIFGVDIQPIATQISKLRFFISLVVDQKPTKDPKTNFGIRPLPNLEAKFVTANTLIPLDKSNNLFTSTDEYRYYENQLQEINHRIFSTKKNKEKEKLQELMLSTRMAMAQTMESMGAIGTTGYHQLVEWNMFDQNASASFFDPEWMFGVKNGFDIVIGNPPFVLIRKELYESLYGNYFKYQEGKIDLYRLFIEKGLSLCHAKGILSYITPNTFLSIKNCTKLRRHILNGNSFVFIDNYDESVFEASVNSIVFLLLKDTSLDTINIHLHSVNGVKSNILYPSIIKGTPQCEISINADNIALNIKDKMQKSSSSLKDIAGVEMCLGAQPYHNTIHTPEEMRSKFLHSDYQINDNYVRDYGGKHIAKYIIAQQSNKWIDYSAEFYTKPAHKFFEGPRIIVREIPSSTLICAYTDSFALFNKSVFIIRNTSSEINTKYLLALLNSKAIGYYISSFGDKSKQTLFPRVSMKMLKQIPIPAISQKKQQLIIDLIDRILSEKREATGIDTSSIEQQIDYYVYHLYGLDYEDIKVIDPEISISEKEYNNYSVK